MILENGVVRTLDPSLPTARALAIAGAHVAGGVGTHESALPSPDVVDLGGRCVLPGLHRLARPLPDLVALAARGEARGFIEPRRGASSAFASHPRHGSWIRGYGWRSAEWDEQPTAAALDAVTGETPALLFSKDYHSAWLNSAALARAEGELEVDGGVVERDAAGEPTGILREESAWQFRARAAMPSEDEFVDATREGLRIAASRGVVAIHDKDGWLGAPGIFQRVRERERPHAPRLAARSRTSASPSSTALGDPLRDRRRLPAHRLPEGVHGRDARLADRMDARRLRRRRSRAARQLAEVIREGARLGWPVGVHAIGDRANREALDAFESTRDAWAPLGLRHRIEHAQCLAPEDVGRFAELGVACSVQFSHAPSDRDLAERFWPDQIDGAYAFRSLLGVAARSSRTARTRRSRSSTRSPGSAPASCGRSTSGRRGIPSSA